MAENFWKRNFHLPLPENLTKSMQTAALPDKPLPRVAYITNKIYPHHNTDTQQVIKNASALHAAGLPVELIIPLQLKALLKPGYDVAEAVYSFYNIEKGLKIKQLAGFPAGGSNIEKFFHPIIAACFVALRRKYDVIYTRDKFSALLALFTGRKFVFETYRRFGDESPKAMSWLAKRAKRKNFLGMVLHSNVAARSMAKVGFPEEKLFVLHNGYDDSDMQPVLSKEEARKQLGLDVNEVYIVYTGNMQKNKCIESLIDIAEGVPGAKFLLVGGREEDVKRLTEYAETKGVSNVILAGHQPIALVSHYLYAADVLIIPPVSAPLEKFGRTVLPFKTFPYLAAGRPIVAADAPDIRELLVHRHNAILVKADDSLQNAAAINELLADKTLMKELAGNASQLAKTLTWEARANKLKAILRKIW